MATYRQLTASDVDKIRPGDRLRFGVPRLPYEVRAIIDGDVLVMRWYRGRGYGWVYRTERLRYLVPYADTLNYLGEPMAEIKFGTGKKTAAGIRNG